MNLLKRFDQWVNQGPFTGLDLGIYRVIFAFCTIWITRDITWLANFPDSVYTAPPGPFSLLSGFPSHTSLVVLEIALYVSLTLLGLGLFTKPVSLVVALLLLLDFGLTYTLGKIDHTFLTVLIPAVMAFANWGDRFSLDSLIRGKPARAQVQWPIRYLALALALSFFTAAGFKAGSGWLEPSTQATRGYFYIILNTQHPGLLAGLADGFKSKFLWELLDWFTVLFEGVFVITFLWWRALRITCAVATQFHVGVFLILGIVHVTEVLVYGAFVSWGLFFARDRWPAAAAFVQRRGVIAAAIALFIAAAGVKLWLVLTRVDWVYPGLGDAGMVYGSERAASAAIIFAGGAIGFAYLVSQFIALTKLRKPGVLAAAER
jgi:hypothetical protein